MSRSVGLKVLAVLLTAISLVVIIGSGIGVSFLEQKNLFTQTPEELEREEQEHLGYNVAEYVIEKYNLYHMGHLLQKVTAEEILARKYSYTPSMIEAGEAFYTLKDQKGQILETNANQIPENTTVIQFEIQLDSSYPVVVEEGSSAEMVMLERLNSFKTEDAVFYDAESMEEAKEIMELELDLEAFCGEKFWQDSNGTFWHSFQFWGPAYTVEISLMPSTFNYYGTQYWQAVNLMYRYRYAFVAGIIVGSLIFVLGLVYLGCVSGKRKDSNQIQLVGLNRLPLDLYLLVAGITEGLLIAFVDYVFQVFMNGTRINYGIVALGITAVFTGTLIATVFYVAITAQVKMGKLYWLCHCVSGQILRKAGRVILMFLKLLPLMWQWLVVGLALMAMALITFDWMSYSTLTFPFLFAMILSIGTVCYGAYAYGTLLKGVKKMSEGDLNHKVPTKYLVGTFRDAANSMNCLADVAVVAANKHMQAERMKTELITNVSHDIKTPLTSIINFVDLLQKPHTDAQGEEYLEVLNRQSHRMKKLIEDLMELSKANTGNLSVNITQMDAVEMLNQALGEFSDKLETARITVVTKHPQIPTMILADGRLAWRVLSNILTNAVKYALPGTRLYVDMVPLPGKVLLSFKNVSREQLNTNAEELMERFVRGDASRNTEGSGLGLNIARSLMEVQHGQLQLLVDGDLFKVTLLFPTENP